VLLKTTDEGNTWEPLQIGVTNDLNGLCFPDDPIAGYVVGSSGLVLKTDDGGMNWIPKPIGTVEFLASVDFPNMVTGNVAGASGVVFRTTDQGENWFQQPSGTSEFLWAVQFPVDELTGFAVGRNGVITKTTDGGGGVEETPSARVRTTDAATIVRGVLNLQPAIYDLPTEIVLLDAAGRRVLNLRPGANDVQSLAPGVYFVRSEPSDVHKIVVTK
jgi:photosystem II stability/assembly factor-like uncharacterized protein